MKAGLMEIGDVFVINKADREGAGGLQVELESVLQLRNEDSWKAPVLSTVASTGEGIDQLGEAIERHRAFLTDSGEGALRRRGRLRAQVRDIVLDSVSRHLWQENRHEELLEAGLNDITEGRADPFAVAEEILESSGLLAALEGDTA
jgi:LAO/AO transport system kinase